MSSKNKVRGNVVEKEVVKAFQKAGHEAKRAWGSDGRALGLTEDIDVLTWRDGGFSGGFGAASEIRGGVPVYFPDKDSTDILKIQCKRKKKLPDWLGFSKNVDAVVVREDRGQLFIIMKLEDYLK